MNKLVTLLLLLTYASTLSAQEDKPVEYSESPEDSYIFKSRSSYASSPAYQVSSTEIFTNQVNVNSAGENMIADAANEPSLAINPTNSDHMIIGWRQFSTITSNFREAGYGYTLDGGLNWTFPEPIEAGIFRSDPVLDVDLNGNFYYNSLTAEGLDFSCNVFKSAPNNTWDTGTYAFGGDKQWMAIDKTGGPTTGNIYALWKGVYSACPPYGFTRSVDNGLSYEACIDLPNSMTRGTLAVGPDGELYICGEIFGQHYVAKSTNAGNPNEALEWDFTSPVDLGGSLSLYDGPNPGGMLGQIWITVDHSGGLTHGNVYLLSTVENPASRDKADVVFSRSTDGGLTWSSPKIINDDNSPDNWNWFGTISVAPNGRIDVAWVDTRNDPGGLMSELYFTSSSDGGLSWASNTSLSDSFDPHLGYPNQDKIGDYYQMVSDDNYAHLAWAATFNGEQDVLYSRITIEEPVSSVDNGKIEWIDISPNPSSGFFKITVGKSLNILELAVYNSMGQRLLHRSMGQQLTLKLDMSNYPTGIYYVELSSDNARSVRKVALN
ncbi:MAG: T9SS type A sorting domain-containing protein [Saprospiraceae bacterium]